MVGEIVGELAHTDRANAERKSREGGEEGKGVWNA